MTAASAVARGRRVAESLMADTFSAQGVPTVETVDGLEVLTRPEQYVTRGKVQGLGGLRGNDPQTRTVTIGGVERPVMNGGLHIPLSAPLPVAGWRFVCTEAGVGSDPALVGRVFEVVEVPAKSFATARRLDVVEIPQEA